jgi:hypothetical protein
MTEDLTRRRLFGLTGASAAAGAAGLAAGGCTATDFGSHDPQQPARQVAAYSAGPPFKSRPDLTPPHVTIRQFGLGRDSRYIFLNAPYSGPGHGGSYIMDPRGHFVWFGPNTAAHRRMNFSVQTFKGQPVLTWFQGLVVEGFGQGELVIADASYKIKHVIKAHGTQLADFHEFVVTPQGTALITIYRKHSNINLTAFHGPANGWIVSGVCQEIDIATGQLLFEWDSWAPSTPHVPLTDTYQLLGVGDGGHGTEASPYNYFHINSIAEVEAGNPASDLLISGRNTFAVYRVRRKTGHIVWQLGGKKSDFTMTRRSVFHWQHHVRPEPNNRMTVFDNGVPREPYSRALLLDVDETAMHVSLKKAYVHPHSPYQSGAMGSAQLLPNGHMFVGWGTQPHFSEFTAEGSLVLQGDIIKGDPSYRAFSQNWSGNPDPAVELPAAAARHRSGGATVYASWNGATAVKSWAVFAGRAASALHQIASAPKNGFETAIEVSNSGPYFQVQAHDAKGRALAKSRPVRIR